MTLIPREFKTPSYREGYSGGVCVVLVGLLGRSGAGACPNLPQRRSGPGSAVSGGAEYQRFFSRAPARSGPLWQIWTTGAAAGPVGRASPASARSMTPTPARAPARRAVADRAGAPFDRAGPARAPPEPRPAPRRRPNPRDRHLTHENVPLADVLAGYPAISAVKWRSRGLPGDLADRRRHDMRDAVSLCGMASPGEPQDDRPCRTAG